MGTESSFRFRLERVRALRARSEDLAKQEFARAVSRLTGSQDRLRAVDAQLDRVRADQRHATRPTVAVSAEELNARQAFAEHVEAQRTVGLRELEQREAEVADRSVQLGRAAREHEILERLKERQRSEYEREVGRREGERLDEIALTRFRRSAA